MNSRATPDFWRLFEKLPLEIQGAARKQYLLWQANPRHASVRFKQVKPDLWSARVTKGYRALATHDGDTWIWFWIGTHDDYEKFLK